MEAFVRRIPVGVLLFAVTSLSLTSCSTHYVYRLDPAAKDVPTFVVVPSDFTTDQILYADRLEQALLTLGVRVYERPRGLKEVETRTGVSAQGSASKAEGVGGNQRVQGAGVGVDVEHIERYLEAEDVRATHIVYSYGRAYHNGPKYAFIEASVKIVERGTGRVLSSFSLEPYNEVPALYQALRSMSVPILHEEAE